LAIISDASITIVQKMQLRINGEDQFVTLAQKNIQGVLDSLSLSGKGRIVECNGQLIHKSSWQSHEVVQNDVIEIIQFMGGG